jgi:hypothetical protein
MKPKNPKQAAYLMGLSDGSRQRYEEGYAAGLRDGEKRIARALRKWLDTFDIDIVCHEDVFDWLIARQKRGKK